MLEECLFWIYSKISNIVIQNYLQFSLCLTAWKEVQNKHQTIFERNNHISFDIEIDDYRNTI